MKKSKSISEALKGCTECDDMENDMESPMPKSKKKMKGMKGFIIIPISKAMMEQDEPSDSEE